MNNVIFMSVDLASPSDDNQVTVFSRALPGGRMEILRVERVVRPILDLGKTDYKEVRDDT